MLDRVKNLLVVEDPARWDQAAPPSEDDGPRSGALVVSAHAYLTDPSHATVRRARVFNLCQDYGYQTNGYYVSLLAEARGHRPLPSVTTLEDFRGGAVRIEYVSSEVQRLVERAFAPLGSHRFVLSIYFGRNLAKRYDRLAQTLFEWFPAPLLRTEFVKLPARDGVIRWRLASVRPIPLGDVPEAHRPFLFEQAARFFARPRVTGPKRVRADLAVLLDPDEAQPPSNPAALDRFERAARKLGVRAERITAEDLGRLAEYDALFIRTTTAVNHYTYRFARRAEAEGAIVIDDARSIVRCTNKVYQAELFARHRVPCPTTRILHAGDVQRAAELGFPLVLKQPDSAFSLGVVKAGSADELHEQARRLLASSELVVAQAFLRSDFDWRVGILAGRVLWVCRYHFPRGHWQIQENREGKRTRYGRHETLDPELAPALVLETAVRAASLVGEGLYGVDLKEIDGKAYVIEVNDNPSLEAGVEDAVGKDGIYRAIAQHFLDRIEARARRIGP